MRRILSLIIFCCVCLFSVSCEYYEVRVDQAKTPMSSKDIIGSTYADVNWAFLSSGFVNIQTETFAISADEFDYKNGDVHRVLINGRDVFEADVWYPYDVEVKIVCYLEDAVSDSYSGNSSEDEVVSSAELQESSTDVTATVWIPTKGGSRYHTDAGCSNMSAPLQISIEEAQQKGFTPCLRCCK